MGKTTAERAADYKARLSASGKVQVAVFLPADALEAIDERRDGRSRGDVIAEAVTSHESAQQPDATLSKTAQGKLEAARRKLQKKYDAKEAQLQAEFVKAVHDVDDRVRQGIESGLPGELKKRGEACTAREEAVAYSEKRAAKHWQRIPQMWSEKEYKKFRSALHSDKHPQEEKKKWDEISILFQRLEHLMDFPTMRKDDLAEIDWTKEGAKAVMHAKRSRTKLQPFHRAPGI